MEKRYTIAEAARLANRTYHTIWHAVNRKQLEALSLNGKLTIAHDVLMTYAAANADLISNAKLAKVLGYTPNATYRWESSAKKVAGRKQLIYWHIPETLEWLQTSRPHDAERFKKFLETKTEWDGDSRQITNN